MSSDRILIVQTGFLGDVILTTPVIRAVHERYPDAQISFLTTPAAEPLVRHHPLLSQVFVFDKRGKESGIRGLFAVAGLLREQNFSRVFSLHKSLRTAALLALAKIPERFGFREAAGKFLYTRTAPRRDRKHDVERNLAILRNVGMEPEQLPATIEVHLSSVEELFLDRFLRSLPPRRLVGIAPGSVWLTKRWTTEGFIDVARHFLERGDEVILVGGKDDRDTAAAIETAFPGRIHNFVGQVSLLESAALVSKLSILVTNDSAPLHLASAFSIPTVALFCATVPEFGFGPWKTISETVGVDGLECRPCGRHGGNRCPTGTHACRLDLRSVAVIAAAERVLERAGSSVLDGQEA